MTRADTVSELLDEGRNAARRAYCWIALAMLAAYMSSGITIVESGDIALVRRFGQWVRSRGTVVINRPGLLVVWPGPIDEVVRIPIQQELAVRIDAFWDDAPGPAPDTLENHSLASEEHQLQQSPSRYVLTGDQSVIQLKAQVRYRVTDPDDYVVSFGDPALAINKIVTSCIATTLNSWIADDVLRLSRGTESLSDAIMEAVHDRMEQSGLGVELTSIEFQEVSPPGQLRDSFLAVHEARVDQDTLREGATVDGAERILTAETLADQYIADAKGKQSSRAATAASEIAAFEVACDAYEGPLKSLVITRLRQDTWRELMRQAKHVLIVPASDKHGTLRLALPEQEKSR